MSLLNLQEMSQIFQDWRLYDKKSFHVIEPGTLTYDVDRPRLTHAKEAKFIRDSFLDGKTIIIKNLESFNEKIREKSASLGHDVDVHMYLTKDNTSLSFPFHQDDKDVRIVMLYGSKKFILKQKDQLIEYVLKAGDELPIPKGVEHRAVSLGASCHLSFGFEPFLKMSVPQGLVESDLKILMDSLV